MTCVVLILSKYFEVHRYNRRKAIGWKNTTILVVCRVNRNHRVPELEEELKDQSEVAQKEKQRADALQAIQDKEEAQTELVREREGTTRG